MSKKASKIHAYEVKMAGHALKRHSGAELPNPHEQAGKARPRPHSLLLRESRGRGRNSPAASGWIVSLRELKVAEGLCLATKSNLGCLL